MPALRSVAALLVVLVLVAGLLLAAEWFARAQVEAVVAEAVSRELREVTDEGAGFEQVAAEVDGLVLVGLLTGRLDTVRVQAEDGVVEGVPVDRLDLTATGVSSAGRTVEDLDATLRLDAGTAVASQLDGGPAGAAADSAEALPPDRVQVSAPFAVPLLGEVPVDVQVQVRVADGGLVVEPVTAVAGGLELDLTQLDVLPSWGIAADELPAGLAVTSAEVVESDGRPVVVADLACRGGCPLG